MNKLIISLAIVIVSLSSTAQEKKSIYDGLTPEQRVQKRQLILKKRTGGYLDRRMPGSGKFVFVNAQSVVPSKVYEDQLPIISDVFAVEVTNCTISVAVDFKNASNVLKELGGNAGLFVVDQPDAPTLYIVPEKGWAFVNVAALSEDKPAADVLAKRVRREVWRGFAMAAGSTDTEWPHCLLGPITSVKALDEIDSEAVSPEPTTKIAKHLQKLGILQFKRITYKQACIEGWAPPPQDEFQRVIWDKIHAEKERGPSNPIQIKP